MYWTKPRVNLSAALGETHSREGKRLMVNCALWNSINAVSWKFIEVCKVLKAFHRIGVFTILIGKITTKHI